MNPAIDDNPSLAPMAKRRSETERSTDRSIDRKAGKAARDTVRDPAPAPKAAKPGRRSEAPSDIVMTRRIERITVEPTPAPLPPSPAAADADRWFEQVPTNPGVPATPLPGRATGRVPLVDPTHAVPHSGAPPWLFPLLLALTALTVGMVIGALVFGGAGARHCEPCGDDAGTSR
jgi:hypothetical protein